MRLLKYILVLLLLVSCSAQEKISPQLEQAVYHFYMGQSYFVQGKGYQAMEEFLQAEQLCKDSDKNVLKGQICWYKGMLYSDKMDYSNALDMFSKSIEFYTLTDVKEPLMYAYEHLAGVYAENGNSALAISYYKEATKLALELRNKMIFSPRDSIVDYKVDVYNNSLMKYSVSVAAEYLSMEGGADLALQQLDSTYKKHCNGMVNPDDYPLLTKIYLTKGNVAKAGECMSEYMEYLGLSGRGEKGVDKDLSLVQEVELYGLLGEVYTAKGDDKRAAKAYRTYILKKDSLAQMVRRESVRDAEQQFWQRQLEVENASIKQRGRYLLVIYLLVAGIVCIVGLNVIGAYRRKIRDKNEQLDEYASTISTLGTRVSNVEESRNNLLTQLDTQKEKERELKELLENRFAEVRELISTYYEFGNSKKLQKKVDELLKLQLSGDNFATIEQVVNAKNNDVIKKVRQKYPALKEENIKLLNLIYAGFSAQEISVILNDTPKNIYVRKSRLKKSLQEFFEQDSSLIFN